MFDQWAEAAAEEPDVSSSQSTIPHFLQKGVKITWLAPPGSISQQGALGRNGFAGQDCGKTFIHPHRNLPPCFVETSRLQSNYVLLKLCPPGRDAKLSECILNEENCSSEQNPKRFIETMVCIVQLALFTDNSRRISVTSSRKPSKASEGVPRNTARHGGEIRLRIFFFATKTANGS